MLELHPNDTSREAKPGVWIFHGPVQLICLVGSVMAFVAIFQILRAIDIDWWLNILISALPLCAVTIIILLLRGKPASYAGDILLLWIWRMKTALYMAGGLERPPLLWLENKVSYPKETK